MAQAEPARPVSANDHIQLALIGAGGQGQGDTKTAVQVPGVKLVAVADCYNGRLARSKELWGDDIFTTRDYNEILARKDIDAVIIATPDHWHKQASIDAMKAGKDVYCEKPMIHLYSDGPEMIETARSTGRILQIGSQRVSSVVYAKAKELLAVGRDRQAEHGYGALGSQLGDGGVELHRAAGCVAGDLRLAALSGHRAEDSVQCGALLPVAQVEGLRQRRGRRSVCASLQRDALHYRLAWADARHGDRGVALLEGRPRCAGRDAGTVRLSRGIQPEPARELRGWRRGERGADLYRLGRHDGDWLATA